MKQPLPPKRKKPMRKSILLAILVTMSAVGYAQSQQVKCESLSFPGYVRVFDGLQCPIGWVPI